MINKFEAVGIFASIGLMALALFLLNADTLVFSSVDADRSAAAVVVAGEDADGLSSAVYDSVDATGDLQNLIIDDVAIGTGEEVKAGDTVTVHYIGTLQNGQQFDNSYTKGSPFTFEVGSGKVIAGWDKGILGMKVGGQRILVIPSEMAYGSKGAGTIPGNATLVFAIELLSVN